MRIAVDAMGGDHGPQVVVDGVKIALQNDAKIKELLLVGREDEVKAALRKSEFSDRRVTIVHASEVLTMDDKPIDGIKKKKDCSILRAVELVKDGKADAVISQGNTGGLVAAAQIRLRRLEGVERPAIACIMPRVRREWLLIDGGANPETTPFQMVQNAIMGNVYYKVMTGHPRPRVGILSNGSEEIKGNDLTRESLKMCRELDFNFVGYVEGSDLFHSRIEVVVTDGFVGNIVLKTAEGMGKAIHVILKSELSANPLRQMGALIAQKGLRALKKKMSPDSHGGAPILGLNGNVLKVHGGAKAGVFANAIHQSTTLFSANLNQIIVAEIAKANERLGHSKNAPVHS